MPPPFPSGHGVLHVHLLLPLRRRIPRFRVRRLRLSTLEMATGPVHVSHVILDIIKKINLHGSIIQGRVKLPFSGIEQPVKTVNDWKTSCVKMCLQHGDMD